MRDVLAVSTMVFPFHLSRLIFGDSFFFFFFNWECSYIVMDLWLLLFPSHTDLVCKVVIYWRLFNDVRTAAHFK